MLKKDQSIIKNTFDLTKSFINNAVLPGKRWKVLKLAYNRHETQHKRPLGRDLDRSWCHHHTTVKLFWSQPCLSPCPMTACPEFHVSCHLGRELFTLPTYFLSVLKYALFWMINAFLRWKCHIYHVLNCLNVCTIFSETLHITFIIAITSFYSYLLL